MGWRETCAVDERMRFVIAAEKRERPLAANCREFGVSRKTGYDWLGRYLGAMGRLGSRVCSIVRGRRAITRERSRKRSASAALRCAGRIRAGGL